MRRIQALGQVIFPQRLPLPTLRARVSSTGLLNTCLRNLLVMSTRKGSIQYYDLHERCLTDVVPVALEEGRAWIHIDSNMGHSSVIGRTGNSSGRVTPVHA